MPNISLYNAENHYYLLHTLTSTQVLGIAKHLMGTTVIDKTKQLNDPVLKEI